MSVAPEIAILAEASLLIPAQPTRAETPGRPAHARYAARHLRILAASPERWWGRVRFDPDRSVRIELEDQPEYGAWLVVLPPARPGQQSTGQQSTGQDCDCDVATVDRGGGDRGCARRRGAAPGIDPGARAAAPAPRPRRRVLDQPARARRPARTGGTARVGRRSLSQSPACAQQIIGSQFISPQCRSNRLNGSRGHFPTCRQRGLIRMIEVRGLSKRYGEKSPSTTCHLTWCRAR
jgi:hypothetical protein